MIFHDTPKNYQYNFQDPATSIMSGIMDLHHDILFLLIIIFSIVTFILSKIIINSYLNWDRLHPHGKRQKQHKRLLLFTDKIKIDTLLSWNIDSQGANQVERQKQHLSYNNIIHGTYLEII